MQYYAYTKNRECEEKHFKINAVSLKHALTKIEKFSFTCYGYLPKKITVCNNVTSENFCGEFYNLKNKLFSLPLVKNALQYGSVKL